MAGKKFEKDSAEWQMFSEFWEIAKRSNSFLRKYNSEFTQSLVESIKLTQNISETQLKSNLTDFWMLCQEFWEIERNDRYWEKLVDETNKFHEKNNNDFSKNIALAFLTKLENKYRKGVNEDVQ